MKTVARPAAAGNLMYLFTDWVTTPENRSARAAVRRVLHGYIAAHQRIANPLFLHGPTGTGKTHLVNALAAALTRRCPDLIVSLLPAADCRPNNTPEPDEWSAAAQ